MREKLRGSAVRRLLKLFVQEKTFVLSSIKRAVHKFLLQKPDLNRASSILGMLKPNGLHVTEMFDSNESFFSCGEAVLGVGSHNFKLEVMDEEHIAACGRGCKEKGQVLESCYFWKLRQCIERGWKPVVDETSEGGIMPLYEVSGNYKKVDIFIDTVSQEMKKMEDSGMAVKGVPGVGDIINPLGAVLKRSDEARAEVIAGVRILDQVSLAKASEILVGMGLPKVKVRISTDLTASGVNLRALTPPFRYPSLADGLRIVSRNDWLGKGDVSRYFNEFPLARESHHLFWVWLLGAYYCLVRCCFGFGPSPFYCSTWSAEFRSWMLAKNVLLCCHMMDDWLVASETEEGCRQKLGVVSNTLTRVGLTMEPSKEEYGQRLLYLGVLIDTISMTVRFEPTNAKCMRLELERHLGVLRSGRDLDKTTIRHVCGKLEWYAGSVLQAGRTHIRSWWLYTFRSK